MSEVDPDAREPEGPSSEVHNPADAGLRVLRDMAEALVGEIDTHRAVDRVVRLLAAHLPLTGLAVARLVPGSSELELLATMGLDHESWQRSCAIWTPELLATSPYVNALIPSVMQAPDALYEALGLDRTSWLYLAGLRHAERFLGYASFLLPVPLQGETAMVLQAAVRTLSVSLHATIEHAELAHLAAERRRLLDTIPAAVFHLRPKDLSTHYANAELGRVLGLPAEELTGSPGLLAHAWDEAERARIEQQCAAVRGGADCVWHDRRFRHRSGRPVTLRLRMYCVDGPTPFSGTLLEGIARDVTEELQVRRQLVQADRLASIGTLAAGIAHEINNPTSFLLLGIQQLGRMMAQLPSDERSAPLTGRMTELVGELNENVQRIVQIVGELKLFARIPESAVSTPVDVNRLLLSALTLANSELRRRAEVELDLGELPLLPGDHARIGQVFLNLLINAAQAITPGYPSRNRVRVQTRAESGYVIVEVSDTGVGIAPEHLARIFDPFFTTKAPGEGTGLGLAISYDLVRKAGGTIHVESEPGKGSVFRVALPVRELGPARGSRPRIEAPPLGARVLIVEDERSLAGAIARALATSHLVDLCHRGDDALRIVIDNGGDFDVVLCDLNLPGLDGQVLYQRVVAAFPELAARFVFITGSGMHSVWHDFVVSSGRPVIEKPFEMEELEDVVTQVAGAARGVPPGPRRS